MKKLLTIVLASITVVLTLIVFIVPAVGQGINTPPTNTVEVATISEDSYIPSEEIEVKEVKEVTTYVEPDYSISELKELMETQQLVKEDVHNKANVFRALGYSDESFEIQQLKKQWNVAHARYLEYYNEYQEKWPNSDEFWAQKEAENPTGTYIWRYLKGLGYSDAVCAGIFGNMMLECGFDEVGSFDLKWWVYDSSACYYGLCQWSKTYFPEVQGADLDGQLECLKDTIKEQIDEAGFVYGGNGFGYEEFLQLEDCKEVAVCFAKAYERCAAQHVWPRRDFAEQAYEYFTN